MPMEINEYNELYHHGVKGMKWGVRRYQNYDGTYTQKGLKRFNESLDKYEKANTKYKEVKKNKQSTDAEKANARIARNEAKRKLNKDYDHLKQDKRGDEGKILYSKGKRIRENAKVSKALNTVSTLSLTAAAYNYQNNGKSNVTKVLASIGGASALADIGVKAKNNYQDQRLRAYYSHTSNY